MTSPASHVLTEAPRVAEAARLMMEFAERTGLLSDRATGARYLWTDAFALCNFLGLGARHGMPRFLPLAATLIERVHHTLGRHRPDDPRHGWLSGLDEETGARHPTRGGLRIGKPLGERDAVEAPDPRREWDRDGQYLHYLTKWMHALDRAAIVLQRPEYNRWARELAATACRAFLQPSLAGSKPSLCWKMSIDLSRPLVTSMGQHDALDALITVAELRHTASVLGVADSGPDLTRELTILLPVIDPEGWFTVDPLGLGGVLIDAVRGAQLAAKDATIGFDLVALLLMLAREGIRHYVAAGDVQRPPAMRLAYRELGLAIGLHALDHIENLPIGGTNAAGGERLVDSVRSAAGSLAARIDSCWVLPRHRQQQSWLEHRDINDVMLATSLLPDCFVALT